MELKHIISELMLFNAVVAFATAVLKMLGRQTKDTIHRLFIYLLLSSFVWSFGFSMLYVQTNIGAAHFWKSFAIAGTVCYMIVAQSLTSKIAGLSRGTVIFFQTVSLLGIPVYLLSIQLNQTE